MVVESFYVCFPGVFEIGRLPLKKSEIGQVVQKLEVVRFQYKFIGRRQISPKTGQSRPTDAGNATINLV